VPGCTYHHASAQVRADGAGARFTWTADVSPDELAPRLAASMDRGIVALARTFGGQSSHGT
jgi:hypothetical protein